MYIHIHGHSHYSLLEAIGKVPKIIDKAKELGFPAIGITDYHGMYGLMEFYTKAKKAEMKVICGIELSLATVLGKKPDGEQFLTLIAKNYDGYKALMKMTTIASTKGMCEIPTITRDLLTEYADNLICIIGAPRSILGYRIRQGKTMDQLIEDIRPFQKLFQDRFYLEIIAQEYELVTDIEKPNNQIILLSEKAQIPCIVSSNFHYIAPKDKVSYEVAMAIKDQKQMTDPSRRRVIGDYHIMSEQEVYDILIKNGFLDNQIQQYFSTNQSVCDSIDLVLPKPIPKFPLYKNPQEFVDLYEKLKDGLVVED